MSHSNNVVYGWFDFMFNTQMAYNGDWMLNQTPPEIYSGRHFLCFCKNPHKPWQYMWIVMPYFMDLNNAITKFVVYCIVGKENV